MPRQAHGSIHRELFEGVADLKLKVGLEPYDRSVSGTPTATRPYRDLGGRTNADLTPRLVSAGEIRHSIDLFLQPTEASEVTVQIDNRDNAFSQLCGGVPRLEIPHWQLRDNQHIGRLLRAQLGVRDREGAYHFIPAYEGLVEYASQTGELVDVRAIGLMESLNEIMIDDNPTFASKKPYEIIESLYDTYTAETGASATYGRPRLDYDSLNDAGPQASGILDVTGTNDSNLGTSSSPKSLAQAMFEVARHGFATIYVDGARRLRYVTREYETTYPDGNLRFDRNLIEGTISLERQFIRNSFTATYNGGSSTYSTAVEDATSIARYGRREQVFALPFFQDPGDVELYLYRALLEFAYPIPKFEAVCTAQAMIYEPGDWLEVFDPRVGLDGRRFQLFERAFDTSSDTVVLTCYNTDMLDSETRLWLIGVTETV